MTTAGTIVDSIAARVRDPSNTAHSRAFVRDIFNRVQTALNCSEGYVLEALPFNTIPGQAIYRLETHTPELCKITDIEVGERFLDRIPWRNLWKSSTTWLSDTGPPIAWSLIGRSLFTIYPVPAEPLTINIRGPKITRILVDDNTPIDLRQEDADVAIDITTAILLLRQREWEAARGMVTRASEKLDLQIPAMEEEMRFSKV